MQRKTSSESDPKVAKRVKAKIQPASQLTDYVRALFYGPSGAGKTRLASSAPNVLLLDVNEKGTASVKRDLNPNVYPIEYWGETTDVFWFLQSGDHDYGIVAIDGVTSLQTLCMKFVMGDEASRDASRDPDMPSRAVWGKVGELMKTTITNYRNLPMHVVFTALTRTRATGEDELDAELFTGPACSPSISGHLEAAVGIIGYLSKREVIVKVKGKEDKKVKRTRTRLLVGPSERFVTKDRYGLLGDHIDAPSLSDIIELTAKEA